MSIIAYGKKYNDTKRQLLRKGYCSPGSGFSYFPQFQSYRFIPQSF